MSTETAPLMRIKPRPEFAGILRQDERFASGQPDMPGENVNGWFDRLMLQSGLELSPAVVLLLSLLGALSLGGLVFVIREHLLGTAVAALIGGAVPVLVVMLIRSRRQSQILSQMPGMISELARAARTGRSLEQCFQLITEDTPQPLGGEMSICSRRMQMGLSPEEALRDLPERTGISTMHVLVTALAVHHQTGGDLVRVLERLAQTIRDRIAFLGRLRTATVASRATAILMLLIPPAVVAFFMLRDPNYIDDLLDSRWGRMTTMAAIVLQVIGTIWVIRILRTSKQQ